MCKGSDVLPLCPDLPKRQMDPAKARTDLLRRIMNLSDTDVAALRCMLDERTDCTLYSLISTISKSAT